MSEQPYKWMTVKDDYLIIEVRVVPNSSKNSISNEGEYLKIKLTAHPIDNKANKALIEYLSKILKTPKTSIEIKSGSTSKNKQLVLPNNILNELYSLLN